MEEEKEGVSEAWAEGASGQGGHRLVRISGVLESDTFILGVKKLTPQNQHVTGVGPGCLNPWAINEEVQTAVYGAPSYVFTSHSL